MLDAIPGEDSVPPGTDDRSAVEERLGCGKEGGGQSETNGESSDDNPQASIIGDERKLGLHGGGTSAEREGRGTGGFNEGLTGVEKCDATPTRTGETPPLTVGSPKSEKNVPSGKNTLMRLSDSINLASSPASPQKGFEQFEEQDKAQAGVGVAELSGKPAQRNRVTKLDDSDQKKTAVEGDATDFDSNQRDQGNKKEPSELALDSLLLSSLADRMKDREERFRKEKKSEAEIEESEVNGKTGNDPGPAKASSHGHGGRIDDRCDGSEIGKGSATPKRDACHDAQRVQSAEDAHRGKLIKHKERLVAPPSTSSGNGLSIKSGSTPLAKPGTPPVDCSSRKAASGQLNDTTSEPTSAERQAASEAAAKMARRRERFGEKGGGSRAPPVRKPLKCKHYLAP